MTNPSVVAIMLTRDRTEMARRALSSFEKQTYACRLVIVDSGTDVFYPDHSREVLIRAHHVRRPQGQTVGELRNVACAIAIEKYDAQLIIHWDDDDVAEPRRIEHQVQHWLASGQPDVVGYSDLLFWRQPPGEAWLYKSLRPNYAPGTSLMYTREYWERNPFKHLPANPETRSSHQATSEDTEFLRNARVITRCSFADGQPMLIATIHGANTMVYNPEQAIAKGSREWRRVPEWDARVREIMGDK